MVATGVPSTIMVPFVGMEFDPSRAQQGPAEMPFAALIIGQMLAAGTGTKEVLTQVFSADEVGLLGGIGSMIHNQAIRFFKNNKFTDCYIVMLEDAVGTQATRTVTYTGTATADGEHSLYVNGYRVVVPVAIDDTATVIGDALVTAMADFDFLPFTVANDAGVVTFTATQDGIAVGDNDIRENDEPTEKTPTGVTTAIAATTPGTVDPDIQDALDAIGDQWFNIYVNPYDDATNLDKLEDYLENVFGPTEQKDGVAYQAQRGTVSELTTFSGNAARNCPHAVLIDAENRKCAKWELSAMVAGASAASVQEDPAVPLHRIKLNGLRPNSISERRTLAERNNLGKNGIMTLIDSVGAQTDSTVTMYLKNSADAVDTAYRFQNTLFILQRLRYRFNNRILTKYPRAKLVPDASRIRAGQQVITPELGKAEAIAWFLAEERDGQVEGLSQFKDDVICRISETNPNRLEWLMSPDLVNQFIVGSSVMQFLQ